MSLANAEVAPHAVDSEVPPLLNVLVDPLEAFRRINNTPSWAFALLAIGLLKLVKLFVFYAPSANPGKVALSFLSELLPTIVSISVAAIGVVALIGLMHGGAAFQKIFAILSHTFFAYVVVTFVWGLLEFAFIPGFEGVPGSPRYSNLGFLVPSDSFAIHQLFSAVDVIIAYHLVLIALGVAEVSPKTSRVTAFVLIAALYVSQVLAVFLLKLAVT
jgi:hypothetical protein